MRIAILQGAFFPVPPLLGGAVEKMWFLLGQEFARRGHHVVHVSRLAGDLPQTETIEGVTHWRVKGYDTPRSGLLLKLYDLLYTIRAHGQLRADYDVIVSNTFWAPIVLPGKSKEVCMVDVQRVPKGQMRFYGKAARLRANSKPVAVAIRDQIRLSSHPKVVTIPNPLPFIPSREVDLAAKKPIILYAGRLHPEKGLDLLIKAFRQTSQQFELQIVGPWEVAFGGGGLSYFQMLQRLAGDAPISFPGGVFDIDALNERYADAAIFVYPSVADKGETFGLAPLEAMAWGCVPVVSGVACFQDFVTPRQNGLIFDHKSPDAVGQLADHIDRLMDDADLRTRLARRAVDVRRTHSIGHIADQFLAEFERIADGTKITTQPL